MKKYQLILTPAQWRLSIISPLLHRDRNEERTLEERMEELAAKTWQRVYGTPGQVAAETIKKWLSRFRAGGVAALEDTRTIIGPSIPEPLGDALAKLRSDHPRWTVQLLLEEMIKKGTWNGYDPSKATIYRWCKTKGLLRSKNKEDTASVAFEFTAFGALWISDHLHGPKITIQGRKRKTYLLAIIDDASRFLVSARFHLSEGVESLITDLRNSFVRFGLPRLFYTDYVKVHIIRVM